MHGAIQVHVPIAKKKKRRVMTPPWWDKELKQEVKKKHKLWKDYAGTRAEEYRNYTQQRNITSQKIQKVKKKYEAMLVDKLKSEPQKLYRYIRSRLKVKAMVGPLEKAPEQLTECDKEAAEVLNSFFESVFVEDYHHTTPHSICK